MITGVHLPGLGAFNDAVESVKSGRDMGSAVSKFHSRLGMKRDG